MFSIVIIIEELNQRDSVPVLNWLTVKLSYVLFFINEVIFISLFSGKFQTTWWHLYVDQWVQPIKFPALCDLNIEIFLKTVTIQFCNSKTLRKYRNVVIRRHIDKVLKLSPRRSIVYIVSIGNLTTYVKSFDRLRCHGPEYGFATKFIQTAHCFRKVSKIFSTLTEPAITDPLKQ